MSRIHGTVRANETAALLVSTALLLAAAPALALVNYDQGARVVLGVQLLEDATDPTTYYYVPQYPRLATREDGSYELLCLKYVDSQGGTSGGLLHALVEFTLPQEQLDKVQAELRKSVGNAKIAGPVQLMQSTKDGEEGTGSFEVVSAVLSNKGDGGFTRSLVASGRAPLTPGSRAVVAAILSPQGATLLWNSLSGPTSDVSVSVHGYYEAMVQGYNARVTANVSTVYEHFSQIANAQQGYTRRQIRDIIDQLHRDGTLKIEVVDRSAGLGIKSDDMAGHPAARDGQAHDTDVQRFERLVEGPGDGGRGGAGADPGPSIAWLLLPAVRGQRRPAVRVRRSVGAQEPQGHPAEHLHAGPDQERLDPSARGHVGQPGRVVQGDGRRQPVLPNREPRRSGIRVPARLLPARWRLPRCVPGRHQLRLGELSQDLSRPARVHQVDSTEPRRPRRRSHHGERRVSAPRADRRRLDELRVPGALEPARRADPVGAGEP